MTTISNKLFFGGGCCSCNSSPQYATQLNPCLRACTANYLETTFIAYATVKMPDDEAKR